ncbi:MAG: hypothetical protein A2Y94_07745 [Caldithrix sp. RBG_13_44_9]|nr:MAG: hypothetical protein A2Y94_07745 [Caldithrix sp. RBG_13_44_9]
MMKKKAIIFFIIDHIPRKNRQKYDKRIGEVTTQMNSSDTEISKINFCRNLYAVSSQNFHPWDQTFPRQLSILQSLPTGK